MNVEPTDDNLKGYQLTYPLTSLQTIANPTEDEEKVMNFIDGLWNVTLEHYKELAKLGKKAGIPSISLTAIKGCDGEFTDALKHAYGHPRDQQTREINTEKPKQMYIPLVTWGRGKKVKNSTPLYDSQNPDDKPQNPEKYMPATPDDNARPYAVMPVVKFRGIYWGQHGSDASWGASLKFELIEATIEPITIGRMPNKRLLPKNTNTVSADDEELPAKSKNSEEEKKNIDESTDFAEPPDADNPPSPKKKFNVKKTTKVKQMRKTKD